MTRPFEFRDEGRGWELWDNTRRCWVIWYGIGAIGIDETKRIFIEDAVNAYGNCEKFLTLVGNPGICKACGRKIWWVTMKSGKLNPITDELLSHFADCPSATEFRKKVQQCAE